MELAMRLSEQMAIEGKHKPKTSQDFLRLLKETPLSDADFVQVVLSVEGLSPDLFPTLADFGTSLVAAHLAQDEPEPVHVAAPALILEGFTGQQGLTDTERKQAPGKTLIMGRGEASFVAKATLAQDAGAALLLVTQSSDSWPFLMTDKQQLGGDISIPVLMVSKPDKARILQRLRSQGGKEQALGGARVTVKTRVRELLCCVCQCELEKGEKAVRLPCLHYYHGECITPWLKDHHTCPVCRYELPTEEGITQKQRNEEVAAMVANTYS